MRPLVAWDEGPPRGSTQIRRREAPRSAVRYGGPAPRTRARLVFAAAGRRGSQPAAPPLWMLGSAATRSACAPVRLSGRLCQLDDRIDKSADLRDRDLDLVAVLEGVLPLGDHAGAGADDGAVPDRIVAGQEVDQLLEGAADPGGVDRAVEDRRAAAQDAAAQVEVHARAGLVGRDDQRADREAALEDLALGQVERILALDVPGRDVVGAGVADDPAALVDHERELGLGGGELGVAA